MRSFQYADAVPAVPSRGDSGVANQIESYFLNNRSKASRASLALRGGGVFMPGAGLPPLPGALVTSRATVTRGENRAHSLPWSFIGIRTGIGFVHWNRVDGSKWEHCLQQCSGVPHFGQGPLKAVPGGGVVDQLSRREAVTACTSLGRRGPVISNGGRGPAGLGLNPLPLPLLPLVRGALSP